MPVKSDKQFRLMQAAAHGKLKGAGPSEEVAEEMLGKTSHTKKSAFAKMGANKKKRGNFAKFKSNSEMS